MEGPFQAYTSHMGSLKASQANLLTRKVLEHLFASGAFAWRQNTQGTFDRRSATYRAAPKKGISDVLGCFQGRFIAIEVKIGKDRLSAEQEGFLASITATGGLAMVVKTEEDFLTQWHRYLTLE